MMNNSFVDLHTCMRKVLEPPPKLRTIRERGAEFQESVRY